MRVSWLGWTVIFAGALALGGCSDDEFVSTPSGGGTGGVGGTGTGGTGATGAGGSSNCPAGFGDCDSDGSCETDTTSDAANCGACGHDCLGGTCQSSACTAVTLADPLGTGTGIHNGFLTLDADNVYFGYMGTPAGGIDKIPKDGSAASVCLMCDAGVPRDLTTDGAHVYWTDMGVTPHEVRRIAVGGGTPETLWSGTLQSGAPTPVAIDQSSVYWYDGGSQNVMSATLTGANPTPVAASATAVLSILSDGGFLYWTNSSDVMSVDLSGGSPVPLVQGRPEPKSLAADATHIYWAEGTWGNPDNAVQRISRSGGTMETVATKDVISIAIDATDVYAAYGGTGEIWTVPKAGGNPTILANSPNAWDIAVDATAIYWSSEGTGQVFKLAK